MAGDVQAMDIGEALWTNHQQVLSWSDIKLQTLLNHMVPKISHRPRTDLIDSRRYFLD